MRLDTISNEVNVLKTTNQQVSTDIKASAKYFKQHNEETIYTKEAMVAMVQKTNEFIEPLRTNLKFQLHEKLDEYYVEVVNSMTDEVIKEIPPKKMLDMYAEMAELMGIIIDQKI